MNWSRISLAIGSAIGVLVFAFLLTSTVIAHVGGFPVDCGTVITKREPARVSSSSSTNTATTDQALRQACNNARTDQAVHAGVTGGGLVLVAAIASVAMHDDRKWSLQRTRLK
jgi:hypothetical protein